MVIAVCNDLHGKNLSKGWGELLKGDICGIENDRITTWELLLRTDCFSYNFKIVGRKAGDSLTPYSAQHNQVVTAHEQL